MKYSEKQNKVVMTDYDSFNIGEILECGQCFRFTKIDEMHYVIVAKNKVLYIKQEDDRVVFYPCNKKDFENIWIDYFDLNTDYYKIKKEICKNDDIMTKAVSYGEGIRILKQDKFECLISFIISQNNRIPQIKKVIENISREYGKKFGDFYLFPTLEELSVADLETLAKLKTGFRNKYILSAIDLIKNSKLSLEELAEKDTDTIRKELMKIKGVGHKVADCVIMFAYSRCECFPTDVWVKRIMNTLYFDNEEKDVEYIHSFAYKKFGAYAGYAQQYLFNYARAGSIGKKEDKNVRNNS